MIKAASEPIGLINSSFAILFHISVLMWAGFFAYILEGIYSKVVSRFLPRNVLKKLYLIDKSADIKTLNTLGAPAPMGQSVGLYVALGLLVLHMIIYALVLAVPLL